LLRSGISQVVGVAFTVRRSSKAQLSQALPNSVVLVDVACRVRWVGEAASGTILAPRPQKSLLFVPKVAGQVLGIRRTFELRLVGVMPVCLMHYWDFGIVQHRTTPQTLTFCRNIVCITSCARQCWPLGRGITDTTEFKSLVRRPHSFRLRCSTKTPKTKMQCDSTWLCQRVCDIVPGSCGTQVV
jgi:hypothetical protein